MKITLLPILIASTFVCVGFAGVGPIMQLYESKPEVDELVASYEIVKSEFISVSVFEDDAVKGYLSFRMEVEIADADRIAEVTYNTVDFMFRHNTISYEEIKNHVNFAIEKNEAAIRNMIKNKFKDKLVQKLNIIDFSFDLRL